MAARTTSEALMARYTDPCYSVCQVYPSAERPLPDDKEINLEYVTNVPSSLRTSSNIP